MQKNNRKIFDTFISRTKIYLAIILILLVVVCVQNQKMIMPSILLYIFIVAYSVYTNNKKKNEISETLQDLTITVDTAAKTTLINSPFPLVILEADGNVMWKSAKFITEFANVDINSYVSDLNADIRNEIKNETKNNQDIIKQMKIGEKDYQVIGRYITLKKTSLITW